MKVIQNAYLSGTWYPGNALTINEICKDYKANSKILTSDSLKKIGGVVPHAGWLYSGKLAFSVFYNLAMSNKDKKNLTLILFGGHLAPYSESTISVADEFETPLGNLTVSKVFVDEFLKNVPGLISEGNLPAPDNTIELQLPFIKYFFDNIEIVVIRPAPNLKLVQKIGETVKKLSENNNIFIVGSTDLTHYGSRFGFTPKGKGFKSLKWVKEVNDKQIVDLSLKLDYEQVLESAFKNSNACCSGSLATTLYSLKLLGAQKGELIEYSTSYDIDPESNDPDNFVGYASILF